MHRGIEGFPRNVDRPPQVTRVHSICVRCSSQLGGPENGVHGIAVQQTYHPGIEEGPHTPRGYASHKTRVSQRLELSLPEPSHFYFFRDSSHQKNPEACAVLRATGSPELPLLGAGILPWPEFSKPKKPPEKEMVKGKKE